MRRRELILSAMAAGLLRGQATVDELVNASEFEEAARRKLSPEIFALISGGDRKAFDKITFRPRLMIDTSKLDLTTEFLGTKMYSPLLIGPVSGLNRFHPDAEVQMTKGAADAKVTLIKPDTPGWATHWDPKKEPPPTVLKGVMTVDEAKLCVDRGVKAIVLSNYTGTNQTGLASPIEVLPKIAAAVNGKIPILIDGGIRRGSDILKAVALGARGVLIARPAVWGLASYGAPGVKAVVDLLLNELARDMGMCGKASIGTVDSSIVRLHA